MRNDNTELFERMPISKAVITLVLPTIVSQIITVAYNMADTFFIGQLGNPHQVAAATLSMPPFVMLTGISNLFGIGGASLISRSLGLGDRDKAKSCAAFSIWTSVSVALIYGLLIFMLRPTVFPLMGTDENTYRHCSNYIFWTCTVGGVPTVLNTVLGHLVRSEGYAKHASLGITLGCILNIILDPIFIFAFKLEVAGAAIATMLSNLISCIYFFILLYKKRRQTTIKFHPRHYTLKMQIPREILLVGFPSCLIMLMGIVSNLVLNKLVVSYSNQAIAGMGIAKKLDMLAFAISNGMTQGVLPLIGYNYASRNYDRMRLSIKTAYLYNMVLAFAGTIILFTCSVPLARFFIDDTETVAYAQHFLRVICITCPAISVTMMTISIFQAVGEKLRPLILSFLRKGGIDIPFMFIMDRFFGSVGIPWATPITDVIAMTVSLILFIPFWKKMKQKVNA